MPIQKSLGSLNRAVFVIMEIFALLANEKRQDDDHEKSERAENDGDQRVLVITELLSGALFFFFCNVKLV